MRVGRIDAVAGSDEHGAILQRDEINIVHRACIQETADLPVQTVDIQPGLLVGRHDQAIARIGIVAPDSGIISRVFIGRADRLRLASGDDRDGREARRSGGAARQEEGRGRSCCEPAHQNVTRTPPLKVRP